MSDRGEVVSLGVRGVRHLKAQARQALRDFPVWIGLGTAITVGAVLICPLTPAGIAAFTCVMVMMLGMLSWAACPGRVSRMPVGTLIGLSVALLLLEAPVLLLLAEGGGPFMGTLMFVASAVIGTFASPLGAWGILLVAPALFGSAFGLGVCYAPHLIATCGLNLPQAIHRSLLAWSRNPVAFLVFVGSGMALVAFRTVAMWIAPLVLLPLPAVAAVLGNMIWTAAALLYAAALVGFGRRVFEATSSTTLE